jgi:hypothetical protein
LSGIDKSNFTEQTELFVSGGLQRAAVHPPFSAARRRRLKRSTQ